MATIQGIYIALFGRPADPLGLAFWNSQTNNGTDLTKLINGDPATGLGPLVGEPEYTDRFEGQSNAQIVNSIYVSLFGHDADAVGLAFYVNQLATGAATIADIAIDIYNGAQGTDADILENKEVAANLFTSNIDTTQEILAYDADAIDDAQAYLAAVTDDDSTIPTEAEAEAVIQAIVDDSTGGTPGDTFTLTERIDAPGIDESQPGSGVDTTGTEADDRYIANSATLNPGDEINGMGGMDRVELTLGGQALLAADLNDSLNSSSVETVQITAVPASILGFPLPGNITLDMLEALGVETLINRNSSANLFVEEVQNNVDIVVDSVGDNFPLFFGVEFDSNVLGSAEAVVDVSLTDSWLDYLGLYTNGDDAIGTLNFTVEEDNYVGLDLSDHNEDELTTVTAAGGGFLELWDEDDEFENVTTLDFSGLEGGSFAWFSSNEADLTYTGGAGIDFLDIGEGELSADDALDGGAESDFLIVNLDDADLIGGANIVNFENIILDGTLEVDTTIEDAEDLGYESISIAGYGDGVSTLDIEEADGVTIRYLGNDFDAQFDDSSDNHYFAAEIEFEATDDVTFVVGIDEDAEGQPETGLSFLADKWARDFDDADNDLFGIMQITLEDTETADLTLNGDFYLDYAGIGAGTPDTLETFTIRGEHDFVLNGGDDAFDGLTFDLVELTGGFSNEGVGPSGSQEFILADLGSSDGAFTNDWGWGGEFFSYDFDNGLPGGDPDHDGGSVLALGGGDGSGDNARDIVTFTTDGFGNIAIEGFGVDSDAGEGDVLDMSALGINPGADITYTDGDDGLLITSSEFDGNVLLVGVTFADLTLEYGAGSENTIFGV